MSINMDAQQMEESGMALLVSQKLDIKNGIKKIEEEMGGENTTRTEVFYRYDLTPEQITSIEESGEFGVRYAESWTHHSGEGFTKWAIYPMSGVITSHTIFHPSGSKSDNPLVEKRHEQFCQWVAFHRQLIQTQTSINACWEAYKRSLITTPSSIGTPERIDENRIMFTDCPY